MMGWRATRRRKSPRPKNKKRTPLSLSFVLSSCFSVDVMLICPLHYTCAIKYVLSFTFHFFLLLCLFSLNRKPVCVCVFPVFFFSPSKEKCSPLLCVCIFLSLRTSLFSTLLFIVFVYPSVFFFFLDCCCCCLFQDRL